MIIFLVRHASAGQTKANPAQDDKRPLDSEGIEQCQQMGRFLSAIKAEVDLILSSPLKRATQTAAFVGNEMGSNSRLQVEPALKPTASFEQFQELLRTHSKLEALMVVGHNPTISHFLSRLVTRGANDRAFEMKKGSIARIEVSANKAVLRWLVTPKIVQALSGSPTDVRQPNAKDETPHSKRMETPVPPKKRKSATAKAAKQKS